MTLIPAPRDAGTPRGRGRPAGASLRSTADFTNDNLSAAHRQLVLFLIVVLTREGACLTRMYERLISRHAQQPGHWLHGKTVKQMQSSCSKYLGKSAKQPLRWFMINDALRVQLPAEELPVILAHAAGLYCRANGLDRPDGEYRGEIAEPAWREDTIVTKAMIQHLLAEQQKSARRELGGALQGELDQAILDVTSELAAARAELAEARAELVHTRAELARTRVELVVTQAEAASSRARLEATTDDRDKYKKLQTHLNRGVAKLVNEVNWLRSELNQPRRNQLLSNLANENDQLRDRVRDLAGQVENLSNRRIGLLQEYFPGVSTPTLRGVVREEAEAGNPRRHGYRNLEVFPPPAHDGPPLNGYGYGRYGYGGDYDFGYGYGGADPRPPRPPAPPGRGRKPSPTPRPSPVARPRFSRGNTA